MSCPCCCGIQGVASSVSIRFGNTLRDNTKDPRIPPCYSNAVLRYCPNAAMDLDPSGYCYFAFANTINYPVEFDAGSGDCNRYDGTYVVDIADSGADLNESLGIGWCTSIRHPNVLADCGPGRASGPYTNPSSISYSVTCSGVLASHVVLNNGFLFGVPSGSADGSAAKFAAISSVEKDAPPPSVPLPSGRRIYSPTVITAPQKIGSSGSKDWYYYRWQYFQSAGQALGCVDWQICFHECPEITLS
jgi:hypothetical protein